MIESLYGVQHGGEVFPIFTAGGEIFAFPSWELLFDLESLPQGTKVAIEYTPKFNRPFFVDGIRAFVPLSQRRYWLEIIKTCKTAHLDLIYLEDFPTFTEIVRRKMQCGEVLGELQKAEPERELELRRTLYRLTVEEEYLSVSQREKTFLERIRATQPKVVIMGQGHTDFLIANGQEFSSRGITVANYRKEVLPLPPSFLFSKDRNVSGVLLEDSSPNPQIIVERTCLERQLRAVTEGRVTDGSPNFIGTWDVEIPARGLFEVYLESGMSGRIEDCLGTATFVGEIGPEIVDFTKSYHPEESSKTAYHDVINYSGRLVGQNYEGVYKVGREPERKFTFQRINS